MKIRLKVIALIASVCAVLVAAEILVERVVIMPSFVWLERSEARTAMRRIDYALDLTLTRLGVSAMDWGNWADTYRFMRSHDADYVRENLTEVGLRQLDVNLLLFVDEAGNIVRAASLEGTAREGAHVDLAAERELPEGLLRRATLAGAAHLRGFVQTSRGVLMLAGAPVLDGNGRGPPRGTVIMGRLLTAALVRELGAQAQVALTMLGPQPGAPESLVEEGDLTRVSHIVNDLYGRPIMTLRVDVPRQITRSGYSALIYASLYLMGAVVVVLVLLLVVLNRVVLAPLARVTQHAVAIGEGTDLTMRLNLDSRDEIGVLAGEFDRMVGRLAESRRQIIDQSFEAGFAELAKGVLHNLGNATTPIGVRLARLQSRLRAAAAEDALQALEELENDDGNAARQAQLAQFVRLACREISLTLQAAESDLAVMSRQLAIVQSALGEQLRWARNQHVIEAVRLPELVAQSLEIVPDASRQRLRVHCEPSMREVGVVHVARSVLRLVLQNLLINAAEAAREASKDPGVVRLGAEILQEGDGTQLHLTCEDDGIGIDSENLRRIFEKGFSTKSRDTNSGIGLHWCASVLAALEGRIWASSRGRGRGATVHVLVPLTTREATTMAGAA